MTLPRSRVADTLAASGGSAAALDCGYLLRVGEIGAHHRHAAVEMRSEIRERIGVPALDERDGLLGQLGHGGSGTGGGGKRMRDAAASGTRTQSGRLVSS